MLKYFLAAVVCTIGLSTVAVAQQDNAAPKANECTDAMVHSMLVSLNKADEDHGFTLKMFETFSMPSGNLIPFTIQLEQGVLYNMNYVVNKDFSQYTFTIIDKDNNKPVNKKVRSKNTNDPHMSLNFVAPYSGQYIIVVSQKVKGQNEVCGGVSVMKAAGNK